MNKKQFIETISGSLHGISKEERNEIISSFIEHFEIGIEKGRLEEEIAESLGNPKQIAKEMRAASYIKRAEEASSASNITRAIFSSISLGFFNLIFLLGPFLAIVGILAGLFAVSIAVTSVGIAGFFVSLFYPLLGNFTDIFVYLNPAVVIFMSLGLGALGILFFIGNIYITKYFFRLVVRYLKFNLYVIKGRRQRDV